MTDKNGHEYTEREKFFMTKIRNGFYQIKFKAGADKGIPLKGFKSIEDAHRGLLILYVRTSAC